MVSRSAAVADRWSVRSERPAMLVGWTFPVLYGTISIDVARNVGVSVDCNESNDLMGLKSGSPLHEI